MSHYPPLKSTAKSREYEFDADSDDLGEVEGGAPLGLGPEAAAAASLPTLPKPPTITVQRPDRDSFSAASDYNDSQRPFEDEDEDDLDDLSYARRAEGSSGSGGATDQPLLKPLHQAAATFDAEMQAFKSTTAGSLVSGVFNQTNSIVGAGIVGLPYALQQAGFLTGLTLLLVLGLVTDWTIRLIAINSKLAGGQSTYTDIVEVCFGPPGRLACAFFQFTFAFGGMAAFLVIIGDTIPHVLATFLPSLANTAVGSVVFSRIVIVPVFTLGLCLPLSLLKDMHRLSAASGFALFQMTVILLVVMFHGPALPPSLRGQGEARWTVIDSGIPAAVAVISFAYVCHHNSLMIFKSISTPTLDRFSALTHYAVGISVAASALMAISGYLTFGQATLGNILNCFPTDDGWATVARLCFGLNMCTTFPLEAFVCREVIESTFFKGHDESLGRHAGITVFLTVGALGLSMATDDLGVVMEVTGGVGAAALAYVLPAACYLKLAPSISDRERLAARACVGFGASVTLLVVLKTLWNTLS